MAHENIFIPVQFPIVFHIYKQHTMLRWLLLDIGKWFAVGILQK